MHDAYLLHGTPNIKETVMSYHVSLDRALTVYPNLIIVTHGNIVIKAGVNGILP